MLRIHFLNVGHGDCTIIEHPSKNITVIDINNSQNYDAESHKELVMEQFDKMTSRGRSMLARALLVGDAERRASEVERIELTDPIKFLKETYPRRTPFRYVQTHPDMDHMRGLKRLYEEVGFTNFWDTKNTKPTPKFRSDADREDWEFYQKLRAGEVDGVYVKTFQRGESLYAFGKDKDGGDGGDRIEILSPNTALVQTCNNAKKSNDLSLVLRVSHGGASVLFPGDAEDAAWDDMIKVYGRRLTALAHHIVYLLAFPCVTY
jgi:competence protein ComEC